MKVSEVFKEVEEKGRTKEMWDTLDTYFDNIKITSPHDYDKMLGVFMEFVEDINIKTEDELNKHLSHIKHPNTPKLWTVEETTSLGESIGIDFDTWRFNRLSYNYVCNMIRSDFYNELKDMFKNSGLFKQTILDNPSFYGHLAKAWLDDADAPSGKLIGYLNLVEGK